MRLPHRFQGQKVKSQSHGAGAYCGGHLAAQLVLSVVQGYLLSNTVFIQVEVISSRSSNRKSATHIGGPSIVSAIVKADTLA